MSDIKMTIKLNDFKDVKEFVEAASKCDFDIDISYNRIVIDAKSILGILSMDLRQPLVVCMHGENPEFLDRLRRFTAAA